MVGKGWEGRALRWRPIHPLSRPRRAGCPAGPRLCQGLLPRTTREPLWPRRHVPAGQFRLEASRQAVMAFMAHLQLRWAALQLAGRQAGLGHGPAGPAGPHHPLAAAPVAPRCPVPPRRRKVPGVGKMTQRMLAAFGMATCGDLLEPSHRGVLWVRRAAGATRTSRRVAADTKPRHCQPGWPLPGQR